MHASIFDSEECRSLSVWNKFYSIIFAGDLAEGGCYGLDVEIVIAWLLENPLASIEGGLK